MFGFMGHLPQLRPRLITVILGPPFPKKVYEDFTPTYFEIQPLETDQPTYSD